MSNEISTADSNTNLNKRPPGKAAYGKRLESAQSGRKLHTGCFTLLYCAGLPVLEKKIFTVGNEKDKTYLKHNSFFAVQSSDAKGHRSIPV